MRGIGSRANVKKKRKERNEEDHDGWVFMDYRNNVEAFERMNILIGPSASESEKIVIDSLVSKYNANASVQYSTLKVKLK